MSLSWILCYLLHEYLSWANEVLHLRWDRLKERTASRTQVLPYLGGIQPGACGRNVGVPLLAFIHHLDSVQCFACLLNRTLFRTSHPRLAGRSKFGYIFHHLVSHPVCRVFALKFQAQVQVLVSYTSLRQGSGIKQFRKHLLGEIELGRCH